MSFDTRNVEAVRNLAEAQRNGNVIGLEAVTGRIVARRDIDDYLLRDPESFNLFLLAMRALQHPDRAGDLMGFYQIAGIHGMPTTPWNGIVVAQKTPGTTTAGYCSHASDTFPTWHRPYLALLEQTIYSTMTSIVLDFPRAERPAQFEAANRFRLPYWDYWRPRGGTARFPGIAQGRWTSYEFDFRLPDIMVARYVMVRLPGDNFLTPVENPLASFKIPRVGRDTSWLDEFGTRTRRYPQAQRPVEAMNFQLNMARESSNTQYLDMLRGPAYKYYADFGTNATDSFGGGSEVTSRSPRGSPRPTGSLEGIHNNYHGLIGGTGGHMGDPQVAAFDPVFWIHHCQIDRLLAIWQATHPNTWFDGAGSRDKEKSLLPFFHFVGRRENQWWNSETVRYTETFGYTYPDLISAPGESPLDIQARYVANYYWTTQARLDKLPKDMIPTNAFEKAQCFRYDDETMDRLIVEASRTGALEPVLPRRSRHLSTSAPGTKSGSRSRSRSRSREPSREHRHSRTLSNVADQIQSSHTVTRVTEAVQSSRTLNHLSDSVQRMFIGQSSFDDVDDEHHGHSHSHSDSRRTRITKGRIISAPRSDLILSNRHEVREAEVRRTWYVDTKVERLTLNGTFTIFFFIGSVDDILPPTSYHTQPTLAGITHNFAAPTERCDNCGRQDEQAQHVSGTVVISPILKDYVLTGELGDLGPRRVERFLVDKLRWRVVTADGQRVDPRIIRGLSFGVSSKITDRESGDVRYQEHNVVIEEILQNAS